MNAFHRTRSDLQAAVQRLDADAAHLHDALDRYEVPQKVGRAGTWLTARRLAAVEHLDADAERLQRTLDRHQLPHKAERAGRWLSTVLAALVRDADGWARRVDGLHPDLLRPARAARLARTAIASTAVLGLVSVMAFASLAGSHRRVQLDRLAGAQAPARLQALSSEDADAKAAPAAVHATGPVPATGGAGPAVAAHADAVAPKTIPANRGALPVGKGMWVWQPERTEGGNPAAIVARAKATGLTHLYVRTGTLKGGFDGAGFLDQLLPAAHASGLRIYGWDFPYLNDIDSDVARAAAAINHITPDGHRIDGFASDIELRSMGVNITPVTAFVYGQKLRAAVGRDVPLIATVPRPSAALVTYPFAEVVAHFDAIAPMVYWMGNDPAATVADTIAKLAPLNRPIIPVGQAYDGGGEGGPPGVPGRDQLLAFMKQADASGAVGVSWWSWQHADAQAWDAVRDAPEFRLPEGSTALTPGQVRAYQALLTSLGFRTPVNGVWDAGTAQALADYQRTARLPITGVVDGPTRE
ncbi:MAG TPA: peptidoglycan-binding domain-containing protein, partial [Acidimicrobiales bacterium]|nr:peptidoglycan-binding domain-containing protein [Acidimicrobiales bacterium]